MRILIASDLHHEGSVDEYQPPSEGYDVAILAGDIDSLAGFALKWAKDPKTFPCAKAVIYVPGNHEYYGTVMQPTVGHIREWAKGSVVHALDGDEVVVDGVRFLGCTLWTDFAMPVFVPQYHRVSDVAFSMQQARASLNDFHLILSEPSAHRFSDPDELYRELLAWEEVKADAAVLISEMRLGTLPPPGRSRVDPARLTHQQLSRWTLTPEETAAIHVEQRAWLQKKLAEPFDGPTVVVTHHAPHRGSVDRRYAENGLSPAFVSDLPEAMFEVPVLWVHGHVHHNFDYRVGKCRVVCNPRGHFRGWPGHLEAENEAFDPAFVVEI